MANDKQRILLTGRWQQKDEKGKIYYTGNLSFGATLLLFKNDKKNDERSPDVLLFLTSKDLEDLEYEYPGSKGEIPF